MSGFLGYIKNKENDFDINKMSDEIMYDKNLYKEYVFNDENLCLTSVSLQNSKNKTINNDKFIITFCGRCYNFKDLNQKFNVNKDNIEEFFSEIYERGILDEVLQEANGIFKTIIYDKINKKIILISDRHGIYFNYYYFKDDIFVFAPEIKCFILSKNIDKTINTKAFDCYMELGYFTEDNTWFENVKLQKPSSIIEYDINSKQLTQRRYWKYSDIKQQDIPFDEAVNKLSELFVSSVLNMKTDEDVVCVPVSGGFDCRMITAVFNKYEPERNLNIYTFGQKGCDDIEFAKKIVRKTNQKHSILDITNEDVLTDRQNGLWICDGEISVQHMHGMHLVKQLPQSITLHYSGVMGGEIFACNYEPSDEDWDKYPTHEIYKNHFKNQTKNLTIDDYYNIPHYYPLIIDNSIRRFSFSGFQYAMSFSDYACPYLENSLLDFILSIPDSYRKSYKLYYSALKKAFPYFYTKIPVTRAKKFNIKIKEPPVENFRSIIRKLKNKLFKTHVQPRLFDYKAYMNNEDNQKTMEEILNKPNELLKQQNFDKIQTFKNEKWENCKYDPAVGLRLVSAKMYFDILNSKLNRENKCV